jgi:hypothetical protein
MVTNIVLGILSVICGLLTGQVLAVAPFSSYDRNKDFLWLSFILAIVFDFFAFILPVSQEFPRLLFLMVLVAPLTFAVLFLGAALVTFSIRASKEGYHTYP